jgi:hypothetical protein
MWALLRQGDEKPQVPDLAQLLWEALLLVESKEGYDPNDPVCVEFRHNVLRIIANLEIKKHCEEGTSVIAKCA